MDTDEQFMTRQERIAFELRWNEEELQNIDRGAFSMYSREHINGVIEALKFVISLENAKVHL